MIWLPRRRIGVDRIGSLTKLPEIGLGDTQHTERWLKGHEWIVPHYRTPPKGIDTDLARTRLKISPEPGRPMMSLMADDMSSIVVIAVIHSVPSSPPYPTPHPHPISTHLQKRQLHPTHLPEPNNRLGPMQNDSSSSGSP